jgi:hypothetical protein
VYIFTCNLALSAGRVPDWKATLVNSCSRQKPHLRLPEKGEALFAFLHFNVLHELGGSAEFPAGLQIRKGSQN